MSMLVPLYRKCEKALVDSDKFLSFVLIIKDRDNVL